MIVTTTPNIEGSRISAHFGVADGEAIRGANIFRDFFATVTHIVGGRSGAYEDALRDGPRDSLGLIAAAARDAGGNAVVGVDFDYEVIGPNGSMPTVGASGTAMRVE